MPCGKERGRWSDLLSLVRLDRSYQWLCEGQHVQGAQAMRRDDTSKPGGTPVGVVELSSICISSPLQVPALEIETLPDQWGVSPLACMAFE